MPYSTPSSTTTTPVTTPVGRPTHRRSYTNERGPGAFASLGALPRRAPPHFHLHQDNSSSNSSDSDEESHQPPPIKFRLQLNTGPVPFPRSSPSPSPLPSPRIYQPLLRPSPSRTSSSPILLSNGKPLKSSLKGSSSSPNIVSLPKHSLHLRARSAPSTPALELLSPTGSDQSVSTPKNVHFPEQQLETVRLFNRSAKPASLLSLEEPETDSEAPQQGFPFPITPPAQPPAYTLQADTIPNPNPPRHVIIESIRMKSLTITGTLLVRNVSFEKHVYVRFTLDDWQTTSEVAGHYSASLPCLPVSISPLTVGDIAAGIVPEAWDRFHYTIRLEDYAPSLASRTMYLVVRYAAGGGEWWDNNDGKNYRVQFSKGATPHLQLPRQFPSQR
ncbi:putative phosphatase regulatory subunit-domain-containing protein [Mucidula mucida]|nr:putative phosphatase regulatory subunit-domain-containing protein [Mucidula mucida]